MRTIKLAVRMLLRTPFVTAVAVLSLALGIGANSAIFSVFDEMLLRALPVRAPQELVNITAPGPMSGSTSCSQAGPCTDIWSYPMFRDLERAQTALAGIAAHRNFDASISINNEPSVADGLWVSGGYFPTLGVQAALGRLFGPSDDAVIGGHDVVVIGHDLWRARFGSRPDVVGRTMVVNGRTMEIVGVTPRGFYGTTLGSRPAVYVPLSMRGAFSVTPYKGFENRKEYWLYVFGRLKSGVSADQAATVLNGVYGPILREIEVPLQKGMTDQGLERFRKKVVVLSPGVRGQSSIHREARTPILMLFAITGVVLLIACANIANLLLARGASRATEMGVRLALGATRKQLVTQLLTEAVILALAGGAISLLVARWTLSAIMALLPPDAAQTLAFGVHTSVIAFAAVLATATGIVFGMFPALHSTRADLISTIRAGAGQIAGGRSAARFRSGLVTAQIALSMALLVSAGLFLKSLVNVSKVELGVRVDHVVTFSISPSRVGYDTARAAVLLRRVEEELGGVPGVTGVTSSMVPVLSGSSWSTDVLVQGYNCTGDADCNASFSEVGPAYFATLGIPLIGGRDISTSDIAGAARVAVVNEAFARKFKLGMDVVGKYLQLTQGRDTLTVTIVGFAKNAGYSGVKNEVPAVFYTPWRQDTRSSYMNFYVRTSLAPEQMLSTIPPVMQRIDPSLPVEELKTMPQQIRENIFLDRMISILATAFAVLATLLAGVGLYGVLAYSVAQRTREIGVRMALGADAGRVRSMVLRQVARMTLIGGAIGVGLALVLGRAARTMLFRLDGHDPVVFTAAVGSLALIALAAGFVPALRASRIDPMHALRYD